MASKSAERFKQGARMWQTTDRQTDHATEKWVATVGIARARAISHTNVEKSWGRRTTDLHPLTQYDRPAGVFVNAFLRVQTVTSVATVATLLTVVPVSSASGYFRRLFT